MLQTPRPLALAAASALWLGTGLAYAPLAHAAPPTVNGSREAGSAPTLPVGDSVDTIGAGNDTERSERHYRVERPDLATQVFVGSAMSVPGIGSDGVRSSTRSAANETCVSGADSVATKPGRAVIANGPNAMEGCSQQQTVTLGLDRFSLADLTSAGKEAPVLLRVVHVPEIENAGELPASLPKQTRSQLTGAQDASVTPGTSITAPAPVESGRSYRLQVTTGTPQYFVVDVGWGQSLGVQLEAARTPEIQAAAANNPELQVDVLGPTLSNVADGDLMLATGSGRRVVWTPPVVWRSYAKGGQAAFLAGKHLVVVGAPGEPFGREATFPYTLTIQVDGQVQGVPRFKGGGPTGTDPSTTTQARTPAKRYAALGLGIAGGLMIIASGVVWLRAR